MVNRDSADKVAERLATGRIRKRQDGRQDGRPGLIRVRAGFGNVQFGHEGGS